MQLTALSTAVEMPQKSKQIHWVFYSAVAITLAFNAFFMFPSGKFSAHSKSLAIVPRTQLKWKIFPFQTDTQKQILFASTF